MDDTKKDDAPDVSTGENPVMKQREAELEARREAAHTRRSKLGAAAVAHDKEEKME